MKNRSCLIPMLMLLALGASAQVARVEVEVYEHAGLSPVVLGSFIKQTQAIFSDVGLPFHIHICPRVLDCETDRTPAKTVIVRIARGCSPQMNNVWRSPLAQSFADRRGGTYATVFLAPVQEQAADNDVPLQTVLAYATAHEIGHLLLGSQSHSPRGLMKARWDKGDFRDIGQNRLHFTSAQVRQLARCCASLSAETGRHDDR
jgi:hypothetical protein